MTIKEKYPQLPVETFDHLSYIQNFFGEEVMVIEDNQESLDLSACVLDGFPTIVIKPPYEPSITDIIHEVWHLYMKAKLAMTNYNFGENLEKEMIRLSGTEETYCNLFVALYSAVQHYYFLKRIAPKYQPYTFLEQTLPEIQTPEILVLEPQVIQGLAIDVVQMKILIQDVQKGNQELNYVDYVSRQAFDLGIKLFEVLKRFDSIEKEFYIMRDLVTILWDIKPEIEHYRKGRTIYFNYK